MKTKYLKELRTKKIVAKNKDYRKPYVALIT